MIEANNGWWVGKLRKKTYVPTAKTKHRKSTTNLRKPTNKYRKSGPVEQKNVKSGKKMRGGHFGSQKLTIRNRFSAFFGISGPGRPPEIGQNRPQIGRRPKKGEPKTQICTKKFGSSCPTLFGPMFDGFLRCLDLTFFDFGRSQGPPQSTLAPQNHAIRLRVSASREKPYFFNNQTRQTSLFTYLSPLSMQKA